MCIFDYACTSLTQFKAQIYKWEDIIKERLHNHINADDLTKQKIQRSVLNRSGTFDQGDCNAVR